MGFLTTYVNFLGWAETLVDFPIIPVRNDPNRVCTVNPKFSQGGVWSISRWKNCASFREFVRSFPLKWYAGHLGVLGVTLWSILHLKTLTEKFLKEDKPSRKFMEEYMVYIVMSAFILLALLNCYEAEHDTSTHVYQNNLLAIRSGVKYQGWPSRHRLPDIEETGGYVLVFGFIFGLPFVGCILAHMRDYDPIDKMLTGRLWLPSPYKDILVMGITSGLLFFGAVSVLPYVLAISGGSIAATAIGRYNLEMSQEMNGRSARLPILPKAESHLDRMWKKGLAKILSMNNKIEPEVNQEEDIPVQILVNGRKQPEVPDPLAKVNSVFRERYLFHNQSTILIRDSNKRLSLYIPTLAGIGITICVMMNYAVIKHSDSIEPIFTAFCVFASVTFTSMTLLLMNYAAQIGIMSEEVINFWKGVRVGRMERRQVKAMQVVYMSMGSWFTIKKASAMDVMDTIMNYTVSFVAV